MHRSRRIVAVGGVVALAMTVLSFVSGSAVAWSGSTSAAAVVPGAADPIPLSSEGVPEVCPGSIHLPAAASGSIYESIPDSHGAGTSNGDYSRPITCAWQNGEDWSGTSGLDIKWTTVRAADASASPNVLDATTGSSFHVTLSDVPTRSFTFPVTTGPPDYKIVGTTPYSTGPGFYSAYYSRERDSLTGRFDTVFVYDTNEVTVTIDPGCVGSSCAYTITLPDGHTRPALKHDLQLLVVTGNGTQTIPLFIGGVDGPANTKPPTAAFVSQETATGSRAWDFDASASTAFGGASIVKYEWDFGDATDSGQKVHHTFTHDGPVHVVLTVTDSTGKTATVAHDIVVASGLVVNSTADAGRKAGAATCDTGSTIAGGATECTLRAAIEALNAGSASSVTFDIPGSTTITPGTDLPPVTAPNATIDGTTQPTGKVTVAGRGLAVHNAAGVTIKGLTFVGGSDYALVFADSPNGSVTGNSIGVASDGTTNPPAGGIAVGGSAGTTIGGSAAADGNVIGAQQDGVIVAPSTVSGGDGVSIIGNTIGVTKTGVPIGSGQIGIFGLSGSSTAKNLTVSNNTVAGFIHNIVVAGAGMDGVKITNDRVGIDPTGAHTVGTPVQNVRVDAVPNATVGSNTVSGAKYDVVVVGSAQMSVAMNPDTTYNVSFSYPGGTPDPGPVVGAHDTISGNTVGLLATGVAPREGIYAWQSGDNLTIGANHVAGHNTDEVVVNGGKGGFVNANTIGVDSGSENATVGIALDGTDTTIVDGNTIGAVSTAVSLAKTAGTLVENNTTGLAADGATAAGDTIGIRVASDSASTIVGPNNVVANASAAGLVLNGSSATVTANRFGVPRFGSGLGGNGTGIVVGPTATNVVIGQSGAGNVLAGNKTGVALQAAGTTVAFNTLGLITSGARGNDTGITAAKDASIHDNIIANSTTVGVSVAAGVTVTLRHNSIYATTTTTGITGAPAAPTLTGAARVQTGTSVRTWLVIDGLPTTGAGTIEVFGNPSCADPEGKVPLFTKSPTPGTSARVINVSGRADLKGLTVTYTDTAGKTSVFSSCADATAWPDSDGDGVPDIVEAHAPATATTEQDPTIASFLTDADAWVAVQATVGHLARVAPIDDPDPSGHPGATFPLGQFTYQVLDVPNAEVAQVQLIVPGGAAIAGWWKYGPTQASGSPHFYGFGEDAASGTGAVTKSVIVPSFGVSTVVILHIQDGGRGDDDAVANGTISDPGAPSVETAPVEGLTTIAPPTPTEQLTGPTASPTPATAPSTNTPTGTLPTTGTPATDELALALAAVAFGSLLVILAQSTKRRRRTVNGPPMGGSGVNQFG